MNTTQQTNPLAYSFDSNTKVRIMRLEFTDSFNTFLVNKESYIVLDLKVQLQILAEVQKSLESITSKGYLNNLDLTTYPIVGELLPYFLNLSDTKEASLFINGDKSMESYKWLYNLILINLYYLCVSSLETISNDHEEDLVAELLVQERMLLAKLDPSIRHHLRKPGISLMKNSYIGFDTEFNTNEISSNTLVSTQLALTSKIFVKLPKPVRYTISQLDIAKNKLQRLHTSSDIFNYSKVESTIHWSIQQIKLMRQGGYEESMLVLSEALKIVKGLKYFEGEEHTTFSFPRSPIQPYIILGESISLKELLEIASSITIPYQEEMSNFILNLIKEICGRNFTLQNGKDQLLEEIFRFYGDYTELEEKFKDWNTHLPYQIHHRKLKEKPEKKLSREYLTGLFPQDQRVCVTSTKNYYLIAHLTQADLSMLSDFNGLKEELNIVNGSFVTLSKPLKYCDKRIHVRDTMLLAPGGSKSLAQIGKLYGEAYHKLSISKQHLNDMQTFLKEERENFIAYALRDALISLVHALWMEEFNFNLGGVGVPLSLSSIGRNYVKTIWSETKYPGYQVSSAYPLGDVATTLTPKGLNAVKKIGFVLPYYIANYKGGRNECYMYGIDRDTVWYDYDLTSAYTTIMSMAGHPDYEKYKRLTYSELKLLTPNEMLYSYLVIYADFEFPDTTKYPSIPCYVDENCTVFPLRGTGVLTGAEYLLAKSQGCKFVIEEIHIIPFKKPEGPEIAEFSGVKPFETILKNVQEKRREYAKGTVSNLIYKEIGNSIYGSVVRGISNKRKYDTQSKSMKRLSGDDLSNPMIASWTTAFIRSIIGESLHAIQSLGGLVVSVTTDGFITNLPDLELKISDRYLFSEFKKIRKVLSDDDTGVELKNEGKGILAWTTRGQLGFESKIIATTGFQHNIYKDKSDLIKVFLETFCGENKTFEYIQTRLRSATEVFKKGGHVTMVYKDQQFRMHFDNKRVLEAPVDSKINDNTLAEVLLDSKPLQSITHGANLRFIGKITKIKQYTRFSNNGCNAVRYKKVQDLAIINFIKGILTEPPMFNLHRVGLEKNKDIVAYLKEFNPEINITVQKIVLLKNRSIRWKSVPRIKRSEDFVHFLRHKFPKFDESAFFRSF